MLISNEIIEMIQSGLQIFKAMTAPGYSPFLYISVC